MRCQLCDQEQSRLARAHIIPIGFFKHMPSRGQATTVNESGEKGRRLQKAIYDPEILCDSCEHGIMRPVDEYAIRVLRDRQGAERIDPVPSSKTALWMFSGLDRRKLRAFFASLLWRMSVSRQVELREISIGCAYEKRIRSDLLTGGDCGYVDVLVSFLTDPLHRAFFLPVRLGIKGPNPSSSQRINGWRVQLPGASITVSLDNRPLPLVLSCSLASSVTGRSSPTPVSTSIGCRMQDHQWIAFETDRQEDDIRRIHGIMTNARRLYRQ